MKSLFIKYKVYCILVYVKTYGNVDLTKLRQMILERYPEAKLKVLEASTIEVQKPAKLRRKRGK